VLNVGQTCTQGVGGGGGAARLKPPPIQIKMKKRKLYSHHDIEHFTWFTLKLKLADEYHLEHIKFITL
jgi:hypothetical protein